MSELSKATYWDTRYVERKNGWDNGFAHPFLPHMRPYLGELADKSILVIGAGPGHDAEWFTHVAREVVAMDFSAEAKKNYLSYYPTAPARYELADFFTADVNPEKFDIVFEHTLLCAIDPARYGDYFRALALRTKPGGSYAAIVWNQSPMGLNGPPFSVANEIVIRHLQELGFQIQVEAPVEPTIRGREGTETFLLAKKGA